MTSCADSIDIDPQEEETNYNVALVLKKTSKLVACLSETNHHPRGANHCKLGMNNSGGEDAPQQVGDIMILK